MTSTSAAMKGWSMIKKMEKGLLFSLTFMGILINMLHSDVFTESFLHKIDPRETQSMPNLSKTTLNDEIEYDLDNYKLNESSKVDTEYEMIEGKQHITSLVEEVEDKLNSKKTSTCESPGSQKAPSKFVSIKEYTNIKSEFRPKFLTTLNKAKGKLPELNNSDRYETLEIIESLQMVDSKISKIIHRLYCKKMPTQINWYY
jgi:hypothetical protein